MKFMCFLGSLLVSATAFADFYVVKDGKLQPDFTYTQWTNDEGVPSPNLGEMDGCVTIDHQMQYEPVRLDIQSNRANFNPRGCFLVVEYQLPEESMLYSEDLAGNVVNQTAVGKDKPTIIISGSSVSGEDAKFDYANDYNVFHANIGGKFNSEASRGL